MKYFHSSGGASNPGFSHRIKVRAVTTEMYEWAEVQPGPEYFDRWYVEWGGNHTLKKDYDVAMFEREECAIMFKLTFGSIA